MDWRWGEADDGNDVLRRIVMLLVSLAALADRAAGMSARRRRAVLGILLPAEAEARAFVIATAIGEPVEAEEHAFCDDLAGFAVRLRTLALMLCLLLAQVQQSALPGGAGLPIAPHNPTGTAGWRVVPSAPDTS